MEIIIFSIFQRPEDLWAPHSLPVSPRPHKKDNSSWLAIQKVMWKLEDTLIKIESSKHVLLCMWNANMLRIGFNELTIYLTFDSYKAILDLKLRPQ